MRAHSPLGPIALVLALLIPSLAAAQGLPQETVSLAGGRLTLGGEATATVAPDDDGQFNDTDYQRSALQLLRLGITASYRPFERLALVTELRAEGDTNGGAWTALPFAAYVRIRPWKDRAFDVQAGRIPPVFGAAGRRIYSNDNVLVGYPLAWQYLTVMRTDAVPANADDLIGARDYQSQPWYSAGAQGYAPGVPLITAFRYDTGVEARLGGEHQRLSWATALTAGTLSSPGARSTNGGPQFSTRLAWRPAVGLVLAGSFADGRFLADGIGEMPAYSPPPPVPGPAPGYDSSYVGEAAVQPTAAPASGHYHQLTWGADGEYSIGHVLVRGEIVSARWTLPVVGTPAIDRPLRSSGAYLEGRYRFAPGFTAALRVDHQTFSDLVGSYGEDTWDAPVTRLEGGVAWSATRNLILRASVQHNRRSRGAVHDTTVPALQVTLWF